MFGALFITHVGIVGLFLADAFDARVGGRFDGRFFLEIGDKCVEIDHAQKAILAGFEDGESVSAIGEEFVGGDAVFGVSFDNFSVQLDRFGINSLADWFCSVPGI